MSHPLNYSCSAWCSYYTHLGQTALCSATWWLLMARDFCWGNLFSLDEADGSQVGVWLVAKISPAPNWPPSDNSWTHLIFNIIRPLNPYGCTALLEMKLPNISPVRSCHGSFSCNYRRSKSGGWMHDSFKFLETNSKAMEIVSTTVTVKYTPLKPRTEESAQPCCVISGLSKIYMGISLLHEWSTWTWNL